MVCDFFETKGLSTCRKRPTDCNDAWSFLEFLSCRLNPAATYGDSTIWALRIELIMWMPANLSAISIHEFSIFFFSKMICDVCLSAVRILNKRCLNAVSEVEKWMHKNVFAASFLCSFAIQRCSVFSQIFGSARARRHSKNRNAILLNMLPPIEILFVLWNLIGCHWVIMRYYHRKEREITKILRWHCFARLFYYSFLFLQFIVPKWAQL